MNPKESLGVGAHLILGLEMRVAEEPLRSLVLEDQDRDYWCWAAVSRSVAKFVRSEKVKSQCELALAMVENCTNCKDDTCDQVEDVEEALDKQAVSYVKEKEGMPGRDLILSQIRANLPVVLRLRRGKGYGSEPHYILLYDCNTTASLVYLQDPARDRRWHGDMRLSDLRVLGYVAITREG